MVSLYGLEGLGLGGKVIESIARLSQRADRGLLPWKVEVQACIAHLGFRV